MLCEVFNDVFRILISFSVKIPEKKLCTSVFTSFYNRSLRGVPYRGKIRTYEGDGYVAELGVNKFTGKMISHKLYKNAWIDSDTLTCFIEFTLFNPNNNLFVTVTLAIEMPDARGSAVVPSYQVKVYQVYTYTSNVLMLLLIQAIYIVSIIKNFYKVVYKSLYQAKFKEGRLFDKKSYGFWEFYEMLRLVIDISVILLYIMKQVVAKQSLAIFHLDKRRFVSFAYNAIVNDMLNGALATAVFLAIIRLSKFFRFNRSVGLFTLVLKISLKNLPSMSMIV